jgi:hypothetical protein
MQYIWNEASDAMHLIALQDITTITELTISYWKDERWMNTKERQKDLARLWEFECECELCKYYESDVEWRARRERLRQNYDLLVAHFKRKELPALNVGFDEMAAATHDVEDMQMEFGGVEETSQLPRIVDPRLQ